MLGKIRHHLLSSYRLSLMHVIKDYALHDNNCENSPAQLAAVMDLNRALLGQNMDLEVLTNPNIMPDLQENIVFKKTKRRRSYLTVGGESFSGSAHSNDSHRQR